MKEPKAKEKEELTPEQERLLGEHDAGKTGKTKKSEGKAEGEGASNLQDHQVPKTHLDQQRQESAVNPGADTKSEGISQATSVLAGAAGQAQGLPTPLPPKEAEAAGFTPKED